MCAFGATALVACSRRGMTASAPVSMVFTAMKSLGVACRQRDSNIEGMPNKQVTCVAVMLFDVLGSFG